MIRRLFPIICLTCALGVSACSTTRWEAPETLQECIPNQEGPVVVALVDTSMSTRQLLKDGEKFREDLTQVVEGTAAAEGTLWVAGTGSDAIGKGEWVVEACGMRKDGTGGSQVQEEEAKETMVEITEEPFDELGSGRASDPGSDLLGALQLAEQTLGDYTDRPRNLVFLTDGAFSGDLEVSNLPEDDSGRQEKLKEISQQIPDLKGDAGQATDVWLAGIGTTTGKSRSPEETAVLIAFWDALIEKTNGNLVSSDQSFSGAKFPNTGP